MLKMTTKLRIALCALIASAALIGCGGDDTKIDDSWNTGEQTIHPEIEAAFISGHLGNYWDCLEDGYSEPEDAGDEPASSEAPGAEGDFVACEEGEDCGYMLNCEHAQVSVRLSNFGEEVGMDLQVTKIELFDLEGESKAILPLMDVTDTTLQTAFNGEVDVDEERTLRIDYQGPASPYDLLSSPSGADSMGYSGTLEITFESSNHDDVIVITTEISPVPGMAT